MKYTKISEDAFNKIQLNAGVLLSTFSPESPQDPDDSSIIGETSGGVNFTATPTYSDFGEDIDNCPKNTMELKRLDSWEILMSGSFVTVTAGLAQRLVGPADLSGNKVTPRNALKDTDFKDLWWVGDYSSINDDGSSNVKAGYVAIHMMNTLSNTGFNIQSSDRAKGMFEFEFMAHYSIENQDKVPFEVYVQTGTASS